MIRHHPVVSHPDLAVVPVVTIQVENQEITAKAHVLLKLAAGADPCQEVPATIAESAIMVHERIRTSHESWESLV